MKDLFTRLPAAKITAIGQFTGKPETATAITDSFLVKVTDHKKGTAAQSFNLTVNPSP